MTEQSRRQIIAAERAAAASHETPTEHQSVAARRADEREAKERKRRSSAIGRRSRGRKIRSAIVAVVTLALVAVALITYRLGHVPSASMEPTLNIGDRIVIDMWSKDVRELTRGDIVVFEDPGAWVPPEQVITPNPIAEVFDTVTGVDSSALLIKRVIGLPGDRVVCCNGESLTVNGIPLDEPYATPGTNQMPFETTVPSGHLWVMGDNRTNSSDSRFHGPVAEELVIGTVPLVFWPLDRFGVLG